MAYTKVGKAVVQVGKSAAKRGARKAGKKQSKNMSNLQLHKGKTKNYPGSKSPHKRNKPPSPKENERLGDILKGYGKEAKSKIKKSTMFGKFKSWAKGSYKQGKKDIGAFSKTPTGKNVGKAAVIGTAVEGGYLIGKSKHQDVQTFHVKRKKG
jgi:hypothetical protein